MFDELSPTGIGSFSADNNNEPRTLFPPLMSALDTYLDSDSNERMHEIITDVKQDKQRKKPKRMKKSPNQKKPTSKQSHSERPATKILPERIGDGYGSPTKTKVKILSNNVEPDEEPQVEERIRTADNLHSQTHPPANGDSNFKIPLSPPGLPNQPRTATSPRSAPRGGRYYKQLDSTAPVGIHSVSIDVSLRSSNLSIFSRNILMNLILLVVTTSLFLRASKYEFQQSSRIHCSAQTTQFCDEAQTTNYSAS